MKRSYGLFTLLFCFWLLCMNASVSEATKRQRSSVTGSYGDDSAHVDVLELPHHRVRLYLWATWKDHFGEVLGVFPLKNHTVVYKAPSGGALTFHFLPDRVQVIQKGRDFECDFGANVNAGGIYRLRSRRAPKFHRMVGEG